MKPETTIERQKESRVNSSLKSEKGRCTIVAVDGPAGSGKSSVCAKVCEELNWTYVNTGFLYRAVAFICGRKGVDLVDSPELSVIMDDFTKNLEWDPAEGKVYLSGEDLSDYLYTDLAGKNASLVAKSPMVREKLLPLQRRLSLQSPYGAIVDGRDIGTVVFPDADLKIFLTASLDERAKRRLIQLHDGDESKISQEELESIKSSIQARDHQDAARGTSPLKQADDAILFDTSSMTVEKVISSLVALIDEKTSSKL